MEHKSQVHVRGLRRGAEGSYLDLATRRWNKPITVYRIREKKFIDMNGRRRVRCLGGATGIGLATAQLASSPGTQVTVVSNRGEDVDNPLDQLRGGTCGYTADLLAHKDGAEL